MPSSVAPCLASQTDEDLLRAYRQREDRAAFAELVRRYEGELYSYLRRYLGDAAMAEDTFQATFLQIHLKCQQFEDGRAVRPWLYTVATNQAIDAQRRNRRHRAVSLDRMNRRGSEGESSRLEMASEEVSPGSQLELTEDRRQIREAVAALPEPLQSTVHLIYYQGLKYREAAEILEVPVGTVKSRMHAAIQRLNQTMSTGSDRHV